MSGPNRLSNARSTQAGSSRSSLLPRLGAIALTFAIVLPAVSGELYQWKDASGVTHYSDSPPPAGADYENRTIRSSGSATLAATPEETPAENSQCTTARGNLALLQGEGPVGADTDKDGKPDAAFTTEQRAAQIQLAEAAIKVHCAAAVEDDGAAAQAD